MVAAMEYTSLANVGLGESSPSMSSPRSSGADHRRVPVAIDVVCIDVQSVLLVSRREDRPKSARHADPFGSISILTYLQD